MSDVLHSRAAEAILADLQNPETPAAAHDVDVALIHTGLANARALREVDTTIRLGLKDIHERLKGPSPAPMVQFTDTEGSPVWFNVRQFVAVGVDPAQPETQSRIDVEDRSYIVAGNVLDVSARIFQVVGGW